MYFVSSNKKFFFYYRSIVMSSREDARNFRFSYSELVQVARNLCYVLQRDLSDLSIFGLTEGNIENLVALCNEFENSKSDVEYEGDLMLTTQAKDEIAEQIKEQIRFMNVRAEAAFGVGAPKYVSFKFEDLNSLTDNELLATFKRVIRLTEQNYDTFQDYGVTEDLLSNLTDLADSFQIALINQEQAIDNRRIAAGERLKQANDIYLFVSNYSNYGKKLFVKSNPAKYQDYIIYSENTPGPVTAPTNFKYHYDTFEFTWDAVANATSYQLQTSNDGVNYSTVQDIVGTSFQNPTSAGDHTYWRIRARNSGGFGEFSTVLNIVITVVNP